MTALSTLSALPSSYAVRLTNQMLISATGEQTDSYLHGQLTVNINDLDKHQVRICAHCDNKGKTWSVPYVARFNDGVVLISNKDAGAHSLAQLNKYGVFSKVDIIDASEAYHHYFISEALANSLCKSFFDSLPDSPMSSVSSANGLLFKTPYTQAGFYALITAEHAEAWEEMMAEAVEAIYGQAVFDAILIDNLIPTLSESGVNEYIPQMLNVQAVEGIDFDKGCYMGQEVVARTRFLGKNKRAAYSFTLNHATSVAPGETLEKQLGENWRRAGNIIATAKLQAETWLMAVLSNDTKETDCHRLAENPDITCYPNTQPYNIEQNPSNIIKKRK